MNWHENETLNLIASNYRNMAREIVCISKKDKIAYKKKRTRFPFVFNNQSSYIDPIRSLNLIFIDREMGRQLDASVLAQLDGRCNGSVF